jgi:hypothetical protein
MRQFRLPNRMFIRASPTLALKLGGMDTHALSPRGHELSSTPPLAVPLKSPHHQVGAKLTKMPSSQDARTEHQAAVPTAFSNNGTIVSHRKDAMTIGAAK